jgi:hypothetical protein
MAHDTYELSVHDGSRFELYRFETEDGINKWLYTTDADDFTLAFETFKPQAIQRSAVEQSSAEGSGQRLEISIPFDAPVAQIHVPYLPPRPVKVTIYSVQRRDGVQEVKQCFIGYVASFSQDGPLMKLHCSHIIDSQQQLVPWPAFQSGCVWAVFSEGCGALQALFETTLQVGDYTINGDEISSPKFALMALIFPDWFRAGKIYNPHTGEKRFITSHVGDTIKLVYPLTTVDATLHGLIAVAGCDGLANTCSDKFDNKANYLGFDHMPDYNVFDGGVR